MNYADYLGKKIVDAAAGTDWGKWLGKAALAVPGVGQLAGLAYNIWNLFDQYEQEQTELEKQNKMRLAREKAETRKLAQMRALNYANNAVYAEQTAYGVSQIKSADISSGLSIYSGYTQRRIQQYTANRERLNYLTMLRNSYEMSESEDLIEALR